MSSKFLLLRRLSCILGAMRASLSFTTLLFSCVRFASPHRMNVSLCTHAFRIKSSNLDSEISISVSPFTILCRYLEIASLLAFSRGARNQKQKEDKEEENKNLYLHVMCSTQSVSCAACYCSESRHLFLDFGKTL